MEGQEKYFQNHWSLRLIRWLCKPELLEEIEGNLIEYQEILLAEKNSFIRLRYWHQVLCYLRPSTLKSITHSKYNTMFYFNPLITFRNLYRHRASSLLNIVCFTLGLTSVLFLYFYIQAELNHDAIPADSERMYRVLRKSISMDEQYEIGVSSSRYAELLKIDHPEDIESTSRIYYDNALVSHQAIRYQENRVIFADPNFFEFFNFPLTEGNSATALQDKNQVVITDKMAQKYFGDKNPIGKVLKLDNEFSFVVSGIAQAIPGKSHIQYDIVLPLSHMQRYAWYGSLTNNICITYLKLSTANNAAGVRAQIPSFMKKHFGEDYAQTGRWIDFDIEPFNDVYFNNKTRYDPVNHGDLSAVRLLIIVAISILFIACFNYVNLSISHSFIRAKEIGIRKVLGVEKGRLVFQFLGESLMILLMAILISVFLCIALRPTLNAYFDLEVMYNWTDFNVLGFFGLLIFIILLTSGLYPALMMSSFEPLKVLKGNRNFFSNKPVLRKGLVITQFVISSFMIIATLLIGIQTHFVNNKELGFNKESVVIVKLNNQQIADKADMFKKQLLEESAIQYASTLSGEPGGFHDGAMLEISGLSESVIVRTLFSDEDYLNVLDVQMSAGAPFRKVADGNPQRFLLLNEKALKETGLKAEELIGRTASLPGWGIDEPFKITGIVKDFHFSSLHDQIEPMAIMSGGWHRKMAIKINANDLRNTLSTIEGLYAGLAPDFPIQYSFLDDGLAKLYENEQKQTRIFSIFSMVSILLACLGIFGLAAYSSQRRQKELSIRKILGASSAQIIGLISKEFLLSVVVAVVIAVPGVWYFMEQWLEGFAYRIQLPDNWYIFVLGGAATLCISLITVIIKTYGVAIADPSETIRNE